MILEQVFADKHFKPKTSLQIALTDPVDTPTSSASSLFLIFSIFSSVIDIDGRPERISSFPNGHVTGIQFFSAKTDHRMPSVPF